MKTKIFRVCFLLFAIMLFSSCSHSGNDTENRAIAVPPETLFGQIFYDVLENDSLFGPGKLFGDSKDFMDCMPKKDMDSILLAYSSVKVGKDHKQLETFLVDNFIIPNQQNLTVFTDTSDIDSHIRKLWKILRRNGSKAQNTGTLIPLKYDYIVPGGRFREVYYWDSYFTMLGLFADNEMELAESMVNNFSDLISRVGFVPNGNRSYYLTRSQPPFFSHMVEALSDNMHSPQVLVVYLEAMQKEYDFWMKGADELTESHKAELHCVRMPGGEVLNRYYDRLDSPREEMYRNDIETAKELKAADADFQEKGLYRNLRSGAESGWDFSSRWLKDYDNLYSIHTTDIVPVDLNSLLFHLEKMLGRAYQQKGENEKSAYYYDKAEKRKTAIKKYMWSEQDGFFMDYDFVMGNVTGNFSLAGVYPLFMGIADENDAARVASKIENEFLKDGGVVTTLYRTGQQWDFPNGWAPLQWITYTAMKNYNYVAIADEIKERWTGMVEKVYEKTGKLLEKYDVVQLSDTGGGEYPNQDGFGWTNGVYRAFCVSDTLKHNY